MKADLIRKPPKETTTAREPVSALRRDLLPSFRPVLPGTREPAFTLGHPPVQMATDLTISRTSQLPLIVEGIRLVELVHDVVRTYMAEYGQSHVEPDRSRHHDLGARSALNFAHLGTEVGHAQHRIAPPGSTGEDKNPRVIMGKVLVQQKESKYETLAVSLANDAPILLNASASQTGGDSLRTLTPQAFVARVVRQQITGTAGPESKFLETALTGNDDKLEKAAKTLTKFVAITTTAEPFRSPATLVHLDMLLFRLENGADFSILPKFPAALTAAQSNDEGGAEQAFSSQYLSENTGFRLDPKNGMTEREVEWISTWAQAQISQDPDLKDVKSNGDLEDLVRKRLRERMEALYGKPDLQRPGSKEVQKQFGLQELVLKTGIKTTSTLDRKRRFSLTTMAPLVASKPKSTVLSTTGLPTAPEYDAKKNLETSYKEALKKDGDATLTVNGVPVVQLVHEITLKYLQAFRQKYGAFDRRRVQPTSRLPLRMSLRGATLGQHKYTLKPQIGKKTSLSLSPNVAVGGLGGQSKYNKFPEQLAKQTKGMAQAQKMKLPVYFAWAVKSLIGGTGDALNWINGKIKGLETKHKNKKQKKQKGLSEVTKEMKERREDRHAVLSALSIISAAEPHRSPASLFHLPVLLDQLPDAPDLKLLEEYPPAMGEAEQAFASQYEEKEPNQYSLDMKNAMTKRETEWVLRWLDKRLSRLADVAAGGQEALQKYVEQEIRTAMVDLYGFDPTDILTPPQENGPVTYASLGELTRTSGVQILKNEPKKKRKDPPMGSLLTIPDQEILPEVLKKTKRMEQENPPEPIELPDQDKMEE